MTDPIDDALYDACDREELVELARECGGAILLYYPPGETRARIKRFNMTWGGEAYLYACATARFNQMLLNPDEGEDDGGD